MTIKQYIIAEAGKSFANFMEAARKVPADKLDWKPLDNGRSVLDQAQECALCPLWVPGILEKRAFDSEGFASWEENKSKLVTLDLCESTGKANLELMKSAIEAFPESDMEVEIDLPWGHYTLAEVMGFPSWNLHYHFGQVAYIQTLYGDFSM